MVRVINELEDSGLEMSMVKFHIKLDISGGWDNDSAHLEIGVTNSGVVGGKEFSGNLISDNS